MIKEVHPASALESSGAFEAVIDPRVWLTVMRADGFRKYEQEEDVTKDLAEFTLANAIFSALVEGHAAEQSARCVRSRMAFFRT